MKQERLCNTTIDAREQEINLSIDLKDYSLNALRTIEATDKGNRTIAYLKTISNGITIQLSCYVAQREFNDMESVEAKEKMVELAEENKKLMAQFAEFQSMMKDKAFRSAVKSFKNK